MIRKNQYFIWCLGPGSWFGKKKWKQHKFWQNAKHYHAIKPIEVKDNIYVMKKAPGAQFNQLIDQDAQRRQENIRKKEMFSLMQNYFQVFLNNFYLYPKHGMKVMHADPHPGNIFINLQIKKDHLHLLIQATS